MIRPFLLAATTFGMTGCVAATGPAPPVAQADLAAELVPAKGAAPPDEPEGACWARDVTPAVIETEIRQEMVSPPGTAEDGTVIPASFRSVTQQKIVQDRRDVWFQTPCPDAMTPAFVASLQRALKARGLFRGPVTGNMDAATAAAVRAYQAPRGLDSAALSLGAARDLGIAPADPSAF